MSSAEGDAKETKPASKGTLLVVDDNEMNRDMLSRRLEKKGFTVQTADDGEKALAAIESTPFDLVLLDVMMPGMSGTEVLERVRKTRNKTELPVIMATAKAESDDVVQALELGANDYVTKPIDFAILLARINTQLGMRQETAKVVAAAPKPDSMRAPPGVGSVIDGRYELVSTVGEGGFAVVYKAQQLTTGRVVAVKILRVDRAGPSPANERARFIQEMQLIGKLQHPNVVRLIDSGEIQLDPRAAAEMARADESNSPPTVELSSGARMRQLEADEAARAESEAQSLPYIVMEFLEGETLSNYLKRCMPLSVDAAVDLVLPVLDAVHAAHAIGVVHRDLKPANIILAKRAEGKIEPTVLDFGIAKNPESANPTLTASFIGTPDYMSPEQALGIREVDGRSDEFALGAVLYEAVTGKRPFKGASLVHTLQLVARGEFPPPREAREDLPVEFEAVLLKAMQRQPMMRYPTLHAFGRSLLRFASRPVAARWSAEFTSDGEDPHNRITAPIPDFPSPSIPPVEPSPPQQPASPPDRSPASSANASVSTLASVARDAEPAMSSRGNAPLVVGAIVMVASTLGVAYALSRAPASADAAHVANAATRFDVTVGATPSTAEIELDGQRVATGTFRTMLARDGTRHVLVVRAPGFVPARIEFRDAPPPATVALTRAPTE